MVTASTRISRFSIKTIPATSSSGGSSVICLREKSQLKTRFRRCPGAPRHRPPRHRRKPLAQPDAPSQYKVSSRAKRLSAEPRACPERRSRKRPESNRNLLLKSPSPAFAAAKSRAERSQKPPPLAHKITGPLPTYEALSEVSERLGDDAPSEIGPLILPIGSARFNRPSLKSVRQ